MDAGLILAAEDEAELAGVMAHEIAHVAACHAARGQTEQLMHMASLSLMMLTGLVGYAAYESLTIATPLTFMKFSRRFESEADFLGVQYMYKAGYDPQAFIAFFERIRNLDKRKENLVVKAFRTHPQTGLAYISIFTNWKIAVKENFPIRQYFKFGKTYLFRLYNQQDNPPLTSTSPAGRLKGRMHQPSMRRWFHSYIFILLTLSRS